MLRYSVKRLLGMIPVLLGVTVVSFALIHLAPGKPTDALTDLNPRMTPEARQRLEQYYGLDQPLHIQYLRWLSRIVRLDFGQSFSADARPVMDKIWDPQAPFLDRRLVITLLINLLAMGVMIGAALPVGLYAAVRPYGLLDRVLTLLVFIGFAAPAFWVALLLMLLFGVHLGWLPLSGITSLGHQQMSLWHQFLDRSAHLILPVCVSAMGGVAGLSRYLRSSMLDVVRQDYILTARAKGLPHRTVILRHALPNALLPVITVLGLSVPGLIGGSVIFESIFGIPGMGQLSYQAIMTRDYPVIMCVLVLTSLLTMIGNLLADLGYAAADPRIRSGV